MNRSSARWLVIGAFLAIIILIANVTITYRNTNELYQTGVMVSHTHDVLVALDDVVLLATGAETGQWGYIITGEESYLEPYTAAVRAINSKVDELAVLTADDPHQQQRIQVLRSRIAAKLNELDRTIVLRRVNGPDAARNAVLSGQGKAEMEAIRSMVGEMTDQEITLRNERLAVRDRAYRAAISEGLFSGILAIAAIVAFLLLLRRHYNERERSAFIIAEQAERMRTTLASIGDGVIATDIDGNVTVMNAVAEELTGWLLDDALGRALTEIFEIVNETTRKPVDNPVMRALSEGVIVGLANHTILIARGGTERPIDDSAAPIRCADGEIVGCVLIFRDISERYRAEAGQRQAQHQVLTTLESVTDGFMRYDKDWRIVYVNAQAEIINRLTRAEMLGRIVWEVFPALVGTHFEDEFRRAVSEQTTVEFENHYEPFGSWYSLKGFPTEDGGLTTYIRDITEQKQSELALRASEERLAFVRRSSGVGFWYCDLPFDVLEWDDLVKSHFHLPPDAAVTIETFYDLIHPGDRERTRQAIQSSITDRTPYDIYYRTVDPAIGTVKWIRAIGRTFYGLDGTPTQFDGVTLDVSEQKQAEEEVIRIAGESERQRRLYETVLTNTPDFVYVFSLDHKVVYANDALIQMWGRGYDGAIGKTFLEIGYEPWHAEMHDREIDQVAATKQPIRGEVPFNGTLGERMYDYIFVPIIGSDGEVEAVAGTTRDVTDQKAAEAEIRALSEYNRNVLESISDPIFTLDRDWRFTYMSSGGEELVMKKPGELNGKVIWDEFPGLIGSPFELLYRQALDGVAGRITDFYPDHNIWYEINLFPSPTGITVYFRNVTERIKREQNLAFLADLLRDFTPLMAADAIIKLAGARITEYLKLSHCVFAEISEEANESVIIYDHHVAGTFDLAGTYPLDQFLDTGSEIRQLSAGSVVTIDDVDEGRSQESAERFSALGIKSMVCAPYLIDGRWLFALAAFRAEPYKWAKDEIDLLQDLAARVCLNIQRARAEEALERARNELEARVQQRTAELAAANTELQAQSEERLHAQEERVRLLGQVISSQEDERHRIARDMHDDLGQRVTALRLHLETLGEIGGDASNRKLLEIREIAKELDSDLSLIVWRLRPAALDNVGLVPALAEYAAKWAASFDTEIEFRSSDFDDSSLSVEVQTCLYRITQEALNNIRKYAEAEAVSVILDRRGHDITLIVEDDGKGFEPSKNKEDKKGFGLIGMAERAGLCGGTVEIESSPGNGTTIYVRVPIPDQAEQT